jgi:single-strand DNA-binding protein
MLNSVNLQGRICQELKIKNIDYQGKSFATLSFQLAVRTGKKDKDNKNITAFIACQATGKTAENLAKYQTKGSQIIVSGSFERQTWKDKEDKYQERCFVKVSAAFFCDSKKETTNKKDETVKPAEKPIDEIKTNDPLPF